MSLSPLLTLALVLFLSFYRFAHLIEALSYSGKPLEITVTVFPRSTWAYNNGPAGNFAQIGWKTNDKIPSGITLDSRRGNGSDDNITWVKTTRSGTELGVAWTVQL
jgi:hypothetical protein